ncbi:MAG: hypothetical protein ACK6BG_10625 [Cyanobacteriota bacterium]
MSRHELDHCRRDNSLPRRQAIPFQARHLFLNSLRATPEALLRLVRDRWSMEGGHWIRDSQLHEDAHRCKGNGAGVMGSLRTAALNLLRLAGYPSIRPGLQSVMHGIGQVVAMARRQPDHTACSSFESALNRPPAPPPTQVITVGRSIPVR